MATTLKYRAISDDDSLKVPGGWADDHLIVEVLKPFLSLRAKRQVMVCRFIEETWLASRAEALQKSSLYQTDLCAIREQCLR